MSEPITLEDGKYTFQENDYILTCKRHGENWRDLTGDKAVMALYNYTLALQGIVVDSFCNCGYIVPSKNANNLQAHKLDCEFLRKLKGVISNDK
jgi:hypothetical protein